MKTLIFPITIILAALILPASEAQVLSIASFNVESDDDTRAELVAEDLARTPPLHIWALQEVEDQATLDLFTSAISNATGYAYENQLGTTGGEWGDHLAFIYISGAFSNVTFEELDNVGGYRHPLVMRAMTAPVDESSAARELVFVNNHFNRGNETTRRAQARNLRDWVAANPDLALILMGSFNFDYDYRGARQGGNRAFEYFSDGGHISWPQHQCIEARNCPGTGSQCNPNYNNMQDFIFLAGRAFDWPALTDLAFLEERYCRREAGGYADHRPVLGQILLPAE
jgi:Endonuclease/Exonuclease/phosphatase family